MATDTLPLNSTTTRKMRHYVTLLKFRLSALVVFSGAFGYLLANQASLDGWMFGGFLLGSFLITGSANTINQIIERDLDKLMKRTAARPLPTGNLSVAEAAVYAALLGVIGVGLIIYCSNLLAGMLGLLSLVLYAFVYTPLKQRSPIAVLVGAFPGALPPLIGWAAAANDLSAGAWAIFAVQFFWQFPHFWAIAWVADEDYRRAGFKMLPFGGEKDFRTAFQMMIYTLVLLPLGILPAYLHVTGVASAIVASIAAALFLLQTFELLEKGTDKAALRIMFSSFLYLPTVQIAFLLDKI